MGLGIRLDNHANKIAAAVYKVIADGKIRTPDMGGNSFVFSPLPPCPFFVFFSWLWRY